MQKRLRFPLNSEQCELLVAFEEAGSMSELAKLMHKDPSVISRQLQGLGDNGVLEKVHGRWALTALGRQVNHWTRSVAASQAKIMAQQSQARFLNARFPSVHRRTVLISLCVQRGFDDPIWGVRHQPQAEDHMATLLSAWRQAQRPVIHVRHHSREPLSPLRPGTMGAAFKDCALPLADETVITKQANAAFVGTDLQDRLKQGDHDTIVLMGFSTNHCLDVTARLAADLGFHVFVVADACVAYDRIGADGELVKAEDTHRVVMANLNQEFATVISTEILLTCLHESLTSPEAFPN